MSKMIFGYGSTFLGTGETVSEDGIKAFYIVFKDTGQENPRGPIADDDLPEFVVDDHVTPDPFDDVVFYFNTREQRDRVFDSFNA
jgi:hypothetical protein